MKPCLLVTVRSASLLVVSIGALVAVAPRTSLAFDSVTRAAWHRTWHAPNALETPLRQYFIPRQPGQCDRAAFAEGYEYVDSHGVAQYPQGWDGYLAACESGAPPAACVGCLPVRSERLGQIPNDLEFDAAVGVSSPGR